MRLGIPRGYFYYDYIKFMRILFAGSDIELVTGNENDEHIMKKGVSLTVDEACLPIKLVTGQIESLSPECDKILMLRIMKDISGRWLCPKLLGVVELTSGVSCRDKLLISDPIYFNKLRATKKSFWKICRELGMKYKAFNENFTRAYNDQSFIASGMRLPYTEAAWEFEPEMPAKEEIILPNNKTVMLAGHNYNIYDKFTNGNIMKKLDDLGIETVTEKMVMQSDREEAIAKLRLEKKPFWESFVRVFGSALYLREKIDGIVYLSSFSCGPDAFTIEMMKTYMKDVPMLILKLDEHRGEAGYDTRLEAFADLLEKRRRAS